MRLRPLAHGRYGDQLRSATASTAGPPPHAPQAGRRKLASAAHASPSPPRSLILFTSTELSLALGAQNVIHTAFLAGRGVERWTQDVERLAGFRPLFP